MGKPNVIESGITPQATLQTEFNVTALRLGALLTECAHSAMASILAAQSAAVERLEQYVPQDRLLTLKEAATYLGYKERTLHEWTKPGKSPLIQFRVLGGEKRFRKSWLDAAIDSGAVKPREVKL